MKIDIPDDFMSSEELATSLSISHRQIERDIMDGLLPAVEFSHRWFVLRRDADRYADRMAGQPE